MPISEDEKAALFEALAEPEPYRSLRLQRERLEQELYDAMRRQNYDAEAEREREKIRRLGAIPCA